MRRLLFAAVMMLSAVVADAQIVYGYFSYNNVLTSMHDYAIVSAQLTRLKEQYEAEAARVEDEFNTKYEAFLEERKDLALVILQKRQAELQDLMEKNIAFKKEAQRLLSAAESDALAPLRNRISETLQTIGYERGYHFIINTDGDACPYMNPDFGEDIEEEIISLLNGGK